MEDNRTDKIEVRENTKTKTKSTKLNMKRVVALVIAAALVVIAMAFIIYRITPTGRHMSGYEYFNVSMDRQENEFLILLDNEPQEEAALMVDGHLYFSRTFAFKNLNKRFYYDKDSNAVIKTDGNTTWTFKANENGYVSVDGERVETDYPVVIDVEGTLYVEAEMLVAGAGFEYETFSEPQRVIIRSDYTPWQAVTVTKDTQVRYRGGIKSPVLEDVKEQQELVFNKDVGDWYEVQTKSGYTGYIKKKCVSEIIDVTKENKAESFVNVEDKPSSLCITWYQLNNNLKNSNVESYLTGVEKTNVISPTWFAVTDGQGTLSDAGSKEFVDKMHKRGIKVWALCNDFATDIDRDTFLESRSVRAKIINNLVSATRGYGADGINIDFEKITAAGSEHYLQFLRELSLQCRKYGLVLSVDNYRPYSFNSQYEVGEQSAYVDYIVLMGYDEHYNGSDAGSVASLPFVEGGVEAMLKKGVDKSQLILGMPFYTRVWMTKDGKTTSSAVSMQTARDVLNNAGAVAQWNEECSQYFGSYENSEGSLVEVWLEEDRSIEEKLKVMEKYGLAGCAQWKLGMENKSVWSVFAKYIKN